MHCLSKVMLNCKFHDRDFFISESPEKQVISRVYFPFSQNESSSQFATIFANASAGIKHYNRLDNHNTCFYLCVDCENTKK